LAKKEGKEKREREGGREREGESAIKRVRWKREEKENGSVGSTSQNYA